MHSPPWVWLVVAVIFACSAYLALQLAEALYGKFEPLADGPRPVTPPLAAPLAAAALFGAFFAFDSSGWPQIAVADFIAAALCAATWTDMTRGFVGDWFSLPPLALVLVLACVRGDIVSVGITVIIVTFPFACGALLSKGRGFGWGDVKLIALGAALLDLETSILVFAVTCFVACGVAFARGRRSEPIAFAPYLAVAIACGFLLPAVLALA